ncbi:MAG: sensor histidine kinase [Pseudomonadota bacterium]
MTVRFLSSASLFQLGFWAVVFLLNVGPAWYRYSSPREVVEVVGTITLLQAMVALIALKYLVPRWLDRGQVKTFSLLLIAVLVLAAELNILLSYLYLEPAYPDTYATMYQAISDLTLIERLGFSWVIRYIVLSKLPVLFFPAAVLLAVSYYRRQQSVLALRDQKRAAELEALKNQLNPHFIFNTLNNIYALAIKRSDQTPEAVAKLAGILDYVLYQCNSPDVSLHKEIQMIEDYIDLERLRFGDRIMVTFEHRVDEGARIAPLLFLTLLENAFKHSASQELNQATVDVSLKADRHHVVFEVSNSKPGQSSDKKDVRAGIGLANLHRQLDLLYPATHELVVNESDRRYQARLELVPTAA